MGVLLDVRLQPAPQFIIPVADVFPFRVFVFSHRHVTSPSNLLCPLSPRPAANLVAGPPQKANLIPVLNNFVTFLLEALRKIMVSSKAQRSSLMIDNASSSASVASSPRSM